MASNVFDRQTVHCSRLISAKFVGKSHPLDGKKPLKLEHMRMFTWIVKALLLSKTKNLQTDSYILRRKWRARGCLMGKDATGSHTICSLIVILWLMFSVQWPAVKDKGNVKYNADMRMVKQVMDVMKAISQRVSWTVYWESVQFGAKSPGERSVQALTCSPSRTHSITIGHFHDDVIVIGPNLAQEMLNKKSLLLLIISRGFCKLRPWWIN